MVEKNPCQGSKVEVGCDTHWCSLGLLSSEGTRRAERGEHMIEGPGACSPVN